MFAIILNAEGYIETCSSKYRTPESVLVDELPEEDPEKLKCYQYIEGEFVFDADKWATYEAEKAERERKSEIMQQIAALKETIKSSDYQIIKCYEYALNNLKLPYDVAALHAERQALRDQINALEEQLNTKEE